MRGYEVEIRNVGTKRLLPDDFQSPITLTSRSDAVFLAAEVREEPPNASAVVRVDGAQLRLDPLLLNSGDRVVLGMVTTAREVDDLTVTGRIADVRKIELKVGAEVEGGNEEGDLWLVGALVAGGFASLIAVIALGSSAGQALSRRPLKPPDIIGAQIAGFWVPVAILFVVVVLRRPPVTPEWLMPVVAVGGALILVAFGVLAHSLDVERRVVSRRVPGWGYVYNATMNPIQLPNGDEVAPGALYSEGSVIAEPLPEGLQLLEVSERLSPYAYDWDEETHQMVPKAEILSLDDRYMLDTSDAQIELRAVQGDLEPLSPSDRRRLEDILWPRFGARAETLADQLVELSRSAERAAAITISGIEDEKRPSMAAPPSQ